MYVEEVINQSEAIDHRPLEQKILHSSPGWVYAKTTPNWEKHWDCVKTNRMQQLTNLIFYILFTIEHIKCIECSN